MAAPPPAPPPPPPIQPSSSILSSSWRASTDSHRQTHHTLSAPPKPAPPRLDPQTLQHAAAGLRKTEYDRSLRFDNSNLSDGRLDRADQQLPGRYRQNGTFNAPMEANQSRETLHATPYDTCNTVPIGNVHRHTNALNMYDSGRPIPSYNTSSSTYTRYTSQHQSDDGNNPRGPPYIADPRSYIRAYATQTPAYTVMEPDYQRQDMPRNYYDTQYPPTNGYDERKFVKEIRDQGLTRTQRIANQYKQSYIRDVPPPQSINNLMRQKERLGSDRIDSLIRDMEWKMKTGVGAAGENNCCKCGESISNDKPGCTALDQMFHVACFTCKECNKQLAGGSFYNVDGKPYCEHDYVKTLERCTSCGEAIMEKLLRASGNAYHPGCFVCSECRKCLDGVPFTVDSSNKVHCVTCFHEKYAPRCAVCSKPIVPEGGEKESVRVVAMDKSFHVNCYRCEDCNMQLSSKIEGQGCYPLDQHLYCKNCNGKRLVALSQAS